MQVGIDEISFLKKQKKFTVICGREQGMHEKCNIIVATFAKLVATWEILNNEDGILKVKKDTNDLDFPLANWGNT